MFTCPYVSKPSFDNKNTDTADMNAAAAFLKKDPAMKRAAIELKTLFLTKVQALLHGDLHTGSVMVTDTDVKIIDSEFAM